MVIHLPLGLIPCLLMGVLMPPSPGPCGNQHLPAPMQLDLKIVLIFFFSSLEKEGARRAEGEGERLHTQHRARNRAPSHNPELLT